MSIDVLIERMKEIAQEEMEATGDGPAFYDGWVPDRWFRVQRGKGAFLTRCENGHVSRTCLRSDDGTLLCVECLGGVVWTFPEDRDGSLENNWKDFKEKGKILQVAE